MPHVFADSGDIREPQLIAATANAWFENKMAAIKIRNAKVFNFIFIASKTQISQ